MVTSGEEGKDPCRASVASRRSCTSSPSISFFPNASRSPRDLTSLAARVHSPEHAGAAPKRCDEDEEPQRCKKLIQVDGSTCPRKHAMPTWHLPSLNFRPLSLVSYAGTTPDRPKSSGGAPSNGPPEILSPTPERPMSSQSRRRFGKILGIDESHAAGSGCCTNIS